MGMDAEIFCIGPYDPSIVDCLPYSAEDYEGTPVGYPVVTTVMSCNTTDASRELARALGVDPGDFGTHRPDPNKINYDSLEEMITHMAEWDSNEVSKLQRLIEAWFICMYCPNY